MFKSLAAKLVLVHLCYLGLLGLLVGSTVLLLKGENEQQLALSLSERQGMLTQRMSQQLLGYAAVVEQGQDALAQREAAVSSMQVFENTLHALEKGGLAPLDLHLVHLEDIDPASQQVGTQLRQIREVYEPFRDQGRIVLKGNKVDRDEAVQEVLKTNTELLTEVQSAAAMIRSEIESRGEFVSRVQSVAFIIGILLTLGLMVVARVLFIQPLAQLNEASNAMSRGEVIQPIAVDGPDEIRELGSSFERLRVSMRNFLGASASGGSL